MHLLTIGITILFEEDTKVPYILAPCIQIGREGNENQQKLLHSPHHHASVPHPHKPFPHYP
jgi:hypothetical protein